MVERVEDLRLDGVEVGELVQALVLRAAQRRHGQRLQVQQLWGGRPKPGSALFFRCINTQHSHTATRILCAGSGVSSSVSMLDEWMP